MFSKLDVQNINSRMTGISQAWGETKSNSRLFYKRPAPFKCVSSFPLSHLSFFSVFILSMLIRCSKFGYILCICLPHMLPHKSRLLKKRMHMLRVVTWTNRWWLVPFTVESDVWFWWACGIEYHFGPLMIRKIVPYIISSSTDSNSQCTNWKSSSSITCRVCQQLVGLIRQFETNISYFGNIPRF